jgi:hypothetical protein
MNTEIRTDPLPVAYSTDLLDFSKITQVMGDYVSADPFLAEELAAGRLAWSKQPFDDHGQADILVMHKHSGAIVAKATVHWSALL